jgi:hypothetical protein
MNEQAFQARTVTRRELVTIHVMETCRLKLRQLFLYTKLVGSKAPIVASHSFFYLSKDFPRMDVRVYY